MHTYVTQFVMAYHAEQDRPRALLPEGFESLRPVLRINAEIRRGRKDTIYLELNTPVAGFTVLMPFSDGSQNWKAYSCTMRTNETAYAPKICPHGP